MLIMDEFKWPDWLSYVKIGENHHSKSSKNVCCNVRIFGCYLFYVMHAIRWFLNIGSCQTFAPPSFLLSHLSSMRVDGTQVGNKAKIQLRMSLYLFDVNVWIGATEKRFSSQILYSFYVYVCQFHAPPCSYTFVCECLCVCTVHVFITRCRLASLCLPFRMTVVKANPKTLCNIHEPRTA